MRKITQLVPLALGALGALATTGAAQTISGDVSELPQSIGGTQKLFLTAGSSFADQTYFVAGTVSGTSPGFSVGGFAIPLNLDFYFNFTVANPNSAVLGNSFGVFDGSGFALATFTLPAGYDASLIGLTASHAYVTLDTTTLALTGASNAADCLLTAGPLPPTLVINELDYDQAGPVDDKEFVEILNVSSQPVDLTNYEVQLLDGLSGGTIYNTFPLAPGGTLGPGEYIVLADNALLSPPGSKTIFWGASDMLQNGPSDGVRIVNSATGDIIDTIVYAGSLPGIGEGTGDTLFDFPDLDNAGFQRCPNGFDSDDNDADFGYYKIITPWADNACN